MLWIRTLILNPWKLLRGTQKQKIVPFLWFDNQAEQAANFYVSVFKNARVKTTSYYSEEAAAASGRPKGSDPDRGFSD